MAYANALAPRLLPAAGSALPEVAYVVLTAGSFDVLVEVVCNDDAHLLAVLNDSVRQVPGVRTAEVFVYLQLAKQTYTWGTPP